MIHLEKLTQQQAMMADQIKMLNDNLRSDINLLKSKGHELESQILEIRI